MGERWQRYGPSLIEGALAASLGEARVNAGGVLPLAADFEVAVLAAAAVLPLHLPDVACSQCSGFLRTLECVRMKAPSKCSQELHTAQIASAIGRQQWKYSHRSAVENFTQVINNQLPRMKQTVLLR